MEVMWANWTLDLSHHYIEILVMNDGIHNVMTNL